MQILSREEFERRGCECYGHVKRYVTSLFASTGEVQRPWPRRNFARDSRLIPESLGDRRFRDCVFALGPLLRAAVNRFVAWVQARRETQRHCDPTGLPPASRRDLSRQSKSDEVPAPFAPKTAASTHSAASTPELHLGATPSLPFFAIPPRVELTACECTKHRHEWQEGNPDQFMLC